MTCCAFIVISKGKVYLQGAHYSEIKRILKSKEEQEFRHESAFEHEQYLANPFIPAIIIDFDKKLLINTSYNYYDNFEKYLQKGWTYKDCPAR
jgi:hypothetical protein